MLQHFLFVSCGIGLCGVRCSFASLYSVHKKMKCCSLDTPENLRWQQQWQVADGSLPASHFYLCKTVQPFLVVVLLALSVILVVFCIVIPGMLISPTSSRWWRNRAGKKQWSKGSSPVAVVFHVLWVFLDTTAISRTGARIKCSSMVLSHVINEKEKQRERGHKQGLEVSSAEH